MAAKVEPKSNQKTVGEGATGGNSVIHSTVISFTTLGPQDTSSLQARQVIDRLVMDVNTVQ